VRQITKQLLKEKDDAWFEEKNGSMTNHWAWFPCHGASSKSYGATRADNEANTQTINTMNDSVQLIVILIEFY
jgi:hypothetical protein